MKNIYLFCSAGMSTSILVDRMRKLAEERKIDVNIQYFTERSIDKEAVNADIILLSPQIKYRKDEVVKKFSDKIVHVIDMQSYGLLKADSILDECVNFLK